MVIVELGDALDSFDDFICEAIRLVLGAHIDELLFGDNGCLPLLALYLVGLVNFQCFNLFVNFIGTGSVDDFFQLSSDSLVVVEELGHDRVQDLFLYDLCSECLGKCIDRLLLCLLIFGLG